MSTGVPPPEILFIVPAPEIEPTVSLKVFISNVPVTVTPLASGITPAAPSLSVPADMVVVPT